MGRSRAPLATAEDEDAGWFQRSKRRRFALGSDISETGHAGAPETKRALYHCNYCNKDISGTIRIKCAKCADFDLCVECFTVGVEITTHKSNHPYRVIDNLSFPLIHPDWNADEEILLLEGVEMYGVGNWAEVSEHVGTKTKTHCYDHYMAAYMNSVCSPLPDMSHVIGKSKTELLAMARTYSEGKKNSGEAFNSRNIKQEPSVSPLRVKIEELKGESLSEGTPTTGSKDGVKKEGEEVDGRSGIGNESFANHPLSAAKKAAGPVHAKEVETVNASATSEDAGQSNRSVGVKKPKPLADEAKPGPSTTDSTGYNPKRQEFDPEYDNDAEQPLAEMEFKDNDTETDRELKLHMLHIYLARLDERKRRKDFILERGLLNIKRQQALDKKKSKEEREISQRTRVFMRYHPAEEHDALVAGLTAEIKIRQRIDELQEYRSAGCQTLSEGMSEKKKRGAEANRKARENALLNSKLSSRSSTRSTIAEASSSGLNFQRYRSSSGSVSRISSLGLKSTKKNYHPLELSGLPGTELLSKTEQDLCSQLRLLPAHYLKMKEVMILESSKRALLKQDDACAMFKVDSYKTERVFEYLWKMSWINNY